MRQALTALRGFALVDGYLADGVNRMDTKSVALGLCLVVAAFAPACSRGDKDARADAGTFPKAAAKAPPARVANSGEVLADLQKSSIRLTVIKDHDTATPVVGTMSLRDGVLSLSDPGLSFARFSFDLGTFESGIPMRNDRVKLFFFEISAKDTAELVVRPLPEAALIGLRDKKPVVHATLEGELTLHGRTAKVPLPVDAGIDARGVLWIKTSKPAEVKISDFGLTENAKRLMSICMHDSIDDIVRVEASLEFPSH